MTNQGLVKDAILLLSDGTYFKGQAAGAIGTTMGELCFNTGMTGYQEIFTDPSYFGQLVVLTNVHVGNYGTKVAENESSDMKISGLICRDFNIKYSRIKGDTDIQTYYEDQKMVGIQKVDTRAIVRHIRSKGAMNAIISSEISDIQELKAKLDKAPNMAGLELASKVSTKEPYYFGDENASYKVAVLDIGVKKSILKCLANQDIYIKVFPHLTSFEEMSAWDPDGYFISNGPGDPEPMKVETNTAKEILKADKPLFGICLGHQILAQAVGVTTYKLNTGHRGINHPIKNLKTGKSEITSQNHGFGVETESVRSKEDVIEVTHINLNDGTIEGIKIKGKPAFSVQYHPEASPGPHDSRYLFEDFKNLIVQHK